mmetsp:Transcript_109890/g.319791  ORF Transcript_109890/g.319791 Transcript_109890/m.319791 type:complete len:264 (-) Transcript_109890:207-998(-)
MDVCVREFPRGLLAVAAPTANESGYRIIPSHVAPLPHPYPFQTCRSSRSSGTARRSCSTAVLPSSRGLVSCSRTSTTSRRTPPTTSVSSTRSPPCARCRSGALCSWPSSLVLLRPSVTPSASRVTTPRAMLALARVASTRSVSSTRRRSTRRSSSRRSSTAAWPCLASSVSGGRVSSRARASSSRLAARSTPRTTTARPATTSRTASKRAASETLVSCFVVFKAAKGANERTTALRRGGHRFARALGALGRKPRSLLVRPGGR